MVCVDGINPIVDGNGQRSLVNDGGESNKACNLANVRSSAMMPPPVSRGTASSSAEEEPEDASSAGCCLLFSINALASFTTFWSLPFL